MAVAEVNGHDRYALEREVATAVSAAWSRALIDAPLDGVEYRIRQIRDAQLFESDADVLAFFERLVPLAEAHNPDLFVAIKRGLRRMTGW
jgi:hypothetical protein